MFTPARFFSLLALVLVAPMAAPPNAQAAEACPGDPLATPAWAGWAEPPTASATTVLHPGAAARVPLTQGPKGGTGSVALIVPVGGTYRVGLDGKGWVDLIPEGGTALPAAGHGHAPACSALAKMVDFVLTPGRYMLTMDQVPATERRVMVVRLP